MTQESIADVFPIWMLFSAAFGFMIGQACGDYYRHRKCLEETNEELRDRLELAQSGDESVILAIKRQRGILHDIHKHVLAVSKGLEKTPPLTPTKSMAGSLRSGRSITYTFRYEQNPCSISILAEPQHDTQAARSRDLWLSPRSRVPRSSVGL